MARHGSLAEQLKAMMDYRNRPEGPVEPVGSNWTVVPANDNANPDELADLSHERKILVTPSVDEIMRQVATDDVERNEAGQVVRIGKLRFSDGTQTEKAYKFGPDNKLVQYDRVMPVGAMLGCCEKTEAALGGRGYSSKELRQSNDFFAETLGTLPARFVKRTTRRNGPGMSRDEAKADYERAVANTLAMPAVTYYPPGLPCGSERISDSFVGMKVSATGGAGSTAWQDISDAFAQREIWDSAMAEMAADDIATLDKSMQAKTLSDLSEDGHRRSAGIRRGRKKIIAANDNLAAALKKASA